MANYAIFFLIFPKGHPNKMFRFPSPDRPIFFEKSKKKIPDSLVKEANTLIYKHTILFINNNWYDVMSLSLIIIDTTNNESKNHVFELTL